MREIADATEVAAVPQRTVNEPFSVRRIASLKYLTFVPLRNLTVQVLVPWKAIFVFRLTPLPTTWKFWVGDLSTTAME